MLNLIGRVNNDSCIIQSPVLFQELHKTNKKTKELELCTFHHHFIMKDCKQGNMFDYEFLPKKGYMAWLSCACHHLIFYSNPSHRHRRVIKRNRSKEDFLFALTEIRKKGD